MKNLIPLLLIFFAPVFIIQIHAQIPSWEEPNPMFSVEKIDLPHKKSRKHKKILGRFHNDDILVQCANTNETSKEFFWVSKSGEIKKADFEMPGLKEVTAFGNKFILFSIENYGKLEYYQADIENGAMKKPKLFQIDWDYNIDNPCLFQLPTSDFPAMVFASDKNGKEDFNLYFSELDGASWSDPDSIDNPTINSPYDETHPFVSGDGMLVFTSNRPQMEAQKLLKKRPTDLWFAQPENYWSETAVNPLPADFCSESSDQNIVLLKNNLRSGYFISDREGQNHELFGFKYSFEEEEETPRYYGLIIGIDAYQYLNPLKYPVAHSQELAKILRENYGFQIEFLPNPTGEEIRQAIAKYHHLQENEYLFISFFGHGILDQKTKVSYLAGRDGRTNLNNCISPESLMQLINSIAQPQQILVVVDACFSGLVVPSGSRDWSSLQSLKMMTSAIDDVVFDKSSFYKFFKKKLEIGRNNINIPMTGQEIADYVRPKMEIDPTDENIIQYKHLPGSNDGDFVFPERGYYLKSTLSPIPNPSNTGVKN